jgi:hypothetical protein
MSITECKVQEEPLFHSVFLYDKKELKWPKQILMI